MTWYLVLLIFILTFCFGKDKPTNDLMYISLGFLIGNAMQRKIPNLIIIVSKEFPWIKFRTKENEY